MEHSYVQRSKFTGRHWAIGIVVLLVALCSASMGFYVYAADLYSEYKIRRLIDSAYHYQRPGGGRLFRTRYSPISSTPHSDNRLGEAQVLLLMYPVSRERDTLQGMIYLASGDWSAFVESVSHLPPERRQNAATLNNLGASFLALSKNDPTFLLKALQQFDDAIKLDPTSVEARFNLVVTYRKLRLPTPERDMLGQYAVLDGKSPWYRELTTNGQVEETTTLDRLRQAIESNRIAEAESLFDKDPEFYRRAVQYGLFDIQESRDLAHFIGNRIEKRYGDKTISAMLGPLFSEQGDVIISIRDLVRRGAELYLHGDLHGSIEAYDQATRLVQETDSIFDRLWIDVNKVDSQIRIGQFDLARDSLQRVISSAQEHQLKWLLAKALSIYGSTLRLTSSYKELMRLLADADRLFVAVNASYERVRPLYYLAGYRFGAGDQDEALKLALECLRPADREDFVRMSALDTLIGSILYQQGFVRTAVLFQTESVEQSKKSANPGLEATAASVLAQLYESLPQPQSTDIYLRVAENAFREIPGPERDRAEVFLNMVKARTSLNRKDYKEAEGVLSRNLDIYAQQPFQPTAVLSQTLMLLARTYTNTDRLNDAAEKFREAINIVENDDHYLETERLRIKFDDERRDLYDSAIEFEYTHGSTDAAWMYLQKYRAKMFLEFLAHFDSNIQQIRSQALDRSKVQKLVPGDTQVIEYALLKDRLLIWVISDKLFTLRSVNVSRSELEMKVGELLQKMRGGDDVTQQLEEFGGLLIDPVADLLNPQRTIAIVPDRALHGLPFAALRRPSSKRYLIESYAIMVSPSLTYLLASDATPPRRDAIVGFGSQNDESSEMLELGSLQKIYPQTTTFVGQTVEKPVFLAAMNTAPVFHYAGHSVTDAVDPLRSSILLDGNRYGPNSVTAVDIAQQRLWKNAVVVLSSCDSSVGNSRDGVGMRGLTSAFLIGGAGSVVGSLWPVEASSTAELMIAFHRAFATTQMPVATALRQAQLNFINSFPDRANPYFWSGFVVTGNFSALR